MERIREIEVFFDLTNISQAKLDDKFESIRKDAIRNNTSDSSFYIEAQLLYNIYSSPGARRGFMMYGREHAIDLFGQEINRKFQKSVDSAKVAKLRESQRKETEEIKRRKRILCEQEAQSPAQNQSKAAMTHKQQEKAKFNTRVVTSIASSKEQSSQAQQTNQDILDLERQRLQQELEMNLDSLRSCYKSTLEDEEAKVEAQTARALASILENAKSRFGEAQAEKDQTDRDIRKLKNQ